jgi:hypothetical protein
MRRVDLRTLDDPALVDGRNLVTASALMDLVSEAWVRRLAGQCRDASAVVLFALTYDGRITCTPEEPEDGLVRRLVNDHQRTDKGFGPALGPAATAAVARSFQERGYEIRREHSDWVLSPNAVELQKQLVDGWARAAIEIAPSEEATIAGWLKRRLIHVNRSASHLNVGHEDIACWLA